MAPQRTVVSRPRDIRESARVVRAEVNRRHIFQTKGCAIAAESAGHGAPNMKTHVRVADLALVEKEIRAPKNVESILYGGHGRIIGQSPQQCRHVQNTSFQNDRTTRA